METQKTPLTVYVAASYPRKAEAKGLAEYIRSLGHRVNARWLDGEPANGNEQEWAIKDADDAIAADCVVCLTGDSLTRGGRHAEVGIAIAMQHRVILVGPQEQLFHFHPLVTHVAFYADLEWILRRISTN